MLEMIQAMMPLLMAVSKHQLDAVLALQVPTSEKATRHLTEDQMGVASEIGSSKLFFSENKYNHAFGVSAHPIVSRALAIFDEAINPPGTVQNERIVLSDAQVKALLSFKWGVGANRIRLTNFSSTGSFKSMDDVVRAINGVRRAFTIIAPDWGPILDNMMLGLFETYPKFSRMVSYEEMTTVVDEAFRSLSHAANAGTLALHPRAAPEKMGYHPQEVGTFMNITPENVVLLQIVEENRQRQYEFVAKRTAVIPLPALPLGLGAHPLHHAAPALPRPPSPFIPGGPICFFQFKSTRPCFGLAGCVHATQRLHAFPAGTPQALQDAFRAWVVQYIV